MKRQKRNPARHLSPQNLGVRITAKSLGFKTTDDLQTYSGIVGQKRALEAIEFGTNINAPGFNLYLLGSQGTGRHELITAFLGEKAAAQADAGDWVYVNNFQTPHKPRAIELAAGRGLDLARAMDEFIDDVRTVIPSFVGNDENLNHLRGIQEELKSKPQEAIQKLHDRAREQNIALLRTPLGFGFAPMDGDEIIKPDAFQKLDEEQRKRIGEQITALQGELKKVVERIPRWEKKRRTVIREALSEMIAVAISAAINQVTEAFGDNPAVAEFLEEVRRDLVKNYDSLNIPDEIRGELGMPGQPSEDKDNSGLFERYRINPIVTRNAGAGVPVVFEASPTLANLLGRVEYLSELGTLMTNFHLIKAGALHRANGGYLILNIDKVLAQPFSWDALKRALTQRNVTIESPGQMLGLISTISLQPEPIPLNVKVILIGSRLLYYLLSVYDQEFLELFKVEADFDQDVARTTDAQAMFPRMIAGLIKDNGLMAFDAAGVALVMQRAIRLAADREKLSVHVRMLTDLLSEADFHAKQDAAKCVGAKYVQRAIDARVRRADRLREQSYEMITRDKVLLNTDGQAIGKINALSVLQLGGFAFGRPTRITAQVQLGAGKVVDIEREVELGGPIHSKGVLILSGFVAARFAADFPLSLSASLVFEQSYGGVDGDSASSAELYVLLSAIAQIPLRQDLAVTGSVNQMGEIQVIGGVNEKIEGFFEICRRRGLTGSQGVLIPAGNVDHLMLEQPVIDAVRHGGFHIYAVASIDQGLELLTGLAAGQRGAGGGFPAGSVNGLVERRLRTLAEARRSFLRPPGDGAPEGPDR